MHPPAFSKLNCKLRMSENTLGRFKYTFGRKWDVERNVFVLLVLDGIHLLSKVDADYSVCVKLDNLVSFVQRDVPDMKEACKHVQAICKNVCAILDEYQKDKDNIKRDLNYSLLSVICELTNQTTTSNSP